MAPLAAIINSYKTNTQPYTNYLHNLAALAIQLKSLKDDRWILEEELCEHYVYVYLDQRKPHGKYKYVCPSGRIVAFPHPPFYVGKGKHGRVDAHLSEAEKRKGKPGQHGHKLNTIWAIQDELGVDPIRIVTASLQTDWMAQALEIDLIAGIGRKNLKLGPLTNLTNGGDGSSGNVPTVEARLKASESNKGMKFSSVSVRKRVKTRTLRGRYAVPLERRKKIGNKLTGRKNGPPSEETRKKISVSNTGKIISEETRRRQREAKLGGSLSKKS